VVVVVRSQEEQQGYGCSSLHGVLCDVKEASRKESCQWVVLRTGRQLRSWGCWRAVHKWNKTRASGRTHILIHATPREVDFLIPSTIRNFEHFAAL